MMPTVGTPQLSIVRKCLIIVGIHAKYLRTLRTLPPEEAVLIGREIDLHGENISPPADDSRPVRHAVSLNVAAHGRYCASTG